MFLLTRARSPTDAMRLILPKLAGFRVSGAPVALRIPELSPQAVYLRPGTSDIVSLRETLFGGYDAAPDFLPRDGHIRIWDLGSNIGLTVSLYACQFPNAHITGVELDPSNAALARRNTAAFGSRCEIRVGAVWVEDGLVNYEISYGREYGAHIRDSRSTQGQNAIAQAWSLNTLLKNETQIDYVKMDIEGAEARVLRERTEWASRVDCIKVECHGNYSIHDATTDLLALGFGVQSSQRHWASVTGTRRR